MGSAHPGPGLESRGFQILFEDGPPFSICYNSANLIGLKQSEKKQDASKPFRTCRNPSEHVDMCEMCPDISSYNTFCKFYSMTLDHFPSTLIWRSQASAYIDPEFPGPSSHRMNRAICSWYEQSYMSMSTWSQVWSCNNHYKSLHHMWFPMSVCIIICASTGVRCDS